MRNLCIIVPRQVHKQRWMIFYSDSAGGRLCSILLRSRPWLGVRRYKWICSFFCTVCARLIKISPVSWQRVQGTTQCKWGRPPSLSSPPRGELSLSIAESNPPIILLVWASGFKADIPSLLPHPHMHHTPYQLNLRLKKRKIFISVRVYRSTSPWLHYEVKLT